MSKGSKEDKAEEGYGISYLAEELDMEPSNVRNALRRLEVEKTDNRYHWSRKSEADAIVKRIKDRAKATAAPAKDEKPAAKGKGGKAGKASAEAETKAKGKAPPKKATAKKAPPKKKAKDEDEDEDGEE